MILSVRTRIAPALVGLLVAVLAFACDDQVVTGPTLADMAGSWTGTSTYPNAPFQVSLTQSGGTLRGRYTDSLDSSQAVTGTFARPTFAIVVDFGDAKLNLNGTMLGAQTAQGVMFTSALGNREYPFTMTR